MVISGPNYINVLPLKAVFGFYHVNEVSINFSPLNDAIHVARVRNFCVGVLQNRDKRVEENDLSQQGCQQIVNSKQRSVFSFASGIINIVAQAFAKAHLVLSHDHREELNRIPFINNRLVIAEDELLVVIEDVNGKCKRENTDEHHQEEKLNVADGLEQQRHVERSSLEQGKPVKELDYHQEGGN